MKKCVVSVALTAAATLMLVRCDTPTAPNDATRSLARERAAAAAARGRIVVSHDDWALTNEGFAAAPDAAQFARNVASWFTGGAPGNFLVYSPVLGLVQSALANTMVSAGHTWTINTSIPFTLDNLLQYDAVFLAGVPVDNDVLIDYVEAGGNVYVAAGTGESWVSAADEAAAWNPFLNHFGLSYASSYNTVEGPVPITSSHPIFAGVSALFQLGGNSVSELDPANPATDIVASAGTDGLYGVVESASSTDVTVSIDVEPGSAEHCINAGSRGVIRAAILGSASFDVSRVDASTVALEGLPVRAVGKKGKLKAQFKNVNGDAFRDLVLQFRNVPGTFASGSTTAVLQGELTDGTAFEGSDTICVDP